MSPLVRKAQALIGLSLAACSLLLCLLLAPSVALAAGSIKPVPAAVDEVEGTWKLKFDIDYGGMPEQQYIPVIFSFEMVVLYERSLTDESGDKPVLNKKQLQNQPPKNIDQVIGFSDGTGKLFKNTKFNFVIRRDRDFEAGEYMVTVKKSDGGAQIGQKFRLTLKGDNPAIDRRAISFVGEKPKKKADKPKTDPAGEGSGSSSGDGSGSGEPSGTGEGSGSGDGAPSGDGAEPPPAVEPKQGGCGCKLATQSSGSGRLGVTVLGLLGLATLGRQRARVLRRRR